MTWPAMILAAGFGTRMGSLTASRPKSLIEVGGRPLLDHAIAAVEGCTPVVVNAHYRAEQIRAYVEQAHPRVLVSEEFPRILDSGGAIKHALSLLGEGPVHTLNADAVWKGTSPIAVLQEAWDPEWMDGLLLLVPTQRAHGRFGSGDFALERTGRIKWDKTASGLIYTGAQILKLDLIRAHEEGTFSLHEIWQPYLDQGRLFGVIYPGHWADVGHPGGVGEAEAMLRDA